MRHWSDLNNALIIDTNAMPVFRENLEKNIKGNVTFWVKKNKIQIINVPGLREHFSKNKRNVETVARKMLLINAQYRVVFKEEYLTDLISFGEKLRRNYKNDKDFDDFWLLAKIKCSFPQNNLFLITNDSRFINFLNRNKIKASLRNKNNLKIITSKRINKKIEIK